MQIGKVKIGLEHKPFIIAEMSGNHNQSLERAVAIVEAAAESGADAVKLQTYTADTMTLDFSENEFFIDDERSPWKGSSLYDLYKTAHTPWDWHEPLIERANQLGMLCFSSPFDASAVDFLETLDVPAYKIASFEIVDLPLIRRVAATKKPMIISTGMATLGEIHEAVEAATTGGCEELALLKCTSTYPATPENSNVRTIEHLRKLYGCEVGLSDHTMGLGCAVAAVAFGATIIEKHFTLRRADGGVDSAFSLEPPELGRLVTETERAWQALGDVRYGPLESETASLAFRRSLFVAEDLNAGDRLDAGNLRIIRPGTGLAPKHYDVVLGRTVKTDVKRGTPLSWELVGD